MYMYCEMLVSCLLEPYTIHLPGMYVYVHLYIWMWVKCVEHSCWSFASSILIVNMYHCPSVSRSVCMHASMCVKCVHNFTLDKESAVLSQLTFFLSEKEPLNNFSNHWLLSPSGSGPTSVNFSQQGAPMALFLGVPHHRTKLTIAN